MFLIWKKTSVNGCLEFLNLWVDLSPLWMDGPILSNSWESPQFISIKMKSLHGRGLLLPTSCQPQLHSYTATHPFQYALHHSRPRKWVRNPRSSTGKEMKKWWNDNFVEMGIFSDRNSKPISVETSFVWSYCLHQHFYLAETRVSCPTGQLGVGSNMFEHVGEKSHGLSLCFPN